MSVESKIVSLEKARNEKVEEEVKEKKLPEDNFLHRLNLILIEIRKMHIDFGHLSVEVAILKKKLDAQGSLTDELKNKLDTQEAVTDTLVAENIQK